ncbi:uncharacterized protein LOC107876154 isoform X1 [Capsicum annuum]|uniref:uncharacterized protein LOC107876154 isoform X1 n=2 Tax=Capsicum annuum TaxID=4072 RepID=UPI0007BFDA77|nr:uncharacterized protein LOC107876154 isoform X1 [Capsicum annuum]
MRFLCSFLHRKGAPRKSKMLDGWKKNKFYSKCKSTIKQTKTRIEMIRKKRNSMQKYLKNDISDLIKSGLDVNAYGRTEGLLVEMNLLSCYDFLDQYCEHIRSHLDPICTERECPESCKEPVGSVMFAAARLADLPELRQLRTMFNERYENSLEGHVNKQFAEKLKQAPHKKDVKLRLMQDIAAEYGIEWNSKNLQQILYEKERADVSGNDKESKDAQSNHENARNHHTSQERTTKSSSDQKSARTKHLDPQSGHKDSGHEISGQRNRDGPSGRATSLPAELEQTSPDELMKGHTRANSCAPDMSGPNGQVHPKVPNYEDVVARLTDLSGKSKE